MNKNKLELEGSVTPHKIKESLARYQREYREKNKESVAGYQREYREKNKESVAAYKREYYRKNKEFVAASRRAYYQKNNLKIKLRRIEREIEKEGKLKNMQDNEVKRLLL